MDWKTLFLTAQGRINRRDFWLGLVLIFVASIVVNLIPVLGQVASLLLFWPQLCIYSKRLHDLGKTAWLLLIPFFAMIIAIVPVVLSGVLIFMMQAAAERGQDARDATIEGVVVALAFFGVAVLVGLGFLLWVGLAKGEPGPNRFGPPPVSLT